MSFIPYIYALSSIVLAIIFVVKSRAVWTRPFRDLSTGQIPVLAVILLAAVYLRFFVFHPRHLLFTDEFIYMTAAKDFATTGVARWHPKFFGWPAILSVPFRIFGAHNLTAIYTSGVLGVLTIPAVYLLAHEIYKDRWIGLGAAFLLAILPTHILWSVTAETTVAALCFATLSLYFIFVFLRTHGRMSLWTASLLMGITAQIRPEGYILFVLLFVGIFVFQPRPKPMDFNFFLPLLVASALSLPNLIKFLQIAPHLVKPVFTNGAAHASPGSYAANFFMNTGIGLSQILINTWHPVLFSCLWIIGLTWSLRKHKREAGFMTLWLIVYFLLYIAYMTIWFAGRIPAVAAGSYVNGRYFLWLYPVFCTLASAGAFCLGRLIKKPFRASCAIIGILTFLAWSTENRYYNDKKDPRHEAELKAIRQLPRFVGPNTIVILAAPEILAGTTNLTTRSLGDYLRDPRARDDLRKNNQDVLFFEDLMCEQARHADACRSIKEQHAHVPLSTHRFRQFGQDRAITLYRLE